MTRDELYIKRTFDIARLGENNVSPNPMVGAVIVYQNKIIGEGWHMEYGGDHAEVNAFKSVSVENEKYLPESTIYVSLEPCCIYGNTPPCSSLIIEKKIPRVVISVIDKTDGVNGKSVQILRDAGIEVVTGILEVEGKKISQIRNHFVSTTLPYVILKFAQSKDGFFGKEKSQVWISNEFTKRLTHKWRSEVDAILIGTNTAMVDNPKLDTRHYFGKSPLRIVLDRNLSIPKTHHLLDENNLTWIITEKDIPNHNSKSNIYHKIAFDNSLFPNILKRLADQNMSSLLVEGGAQLLKSIISTDNWDEIRVFEGNITLGEGIEAPIFDNSNSLSMNILDNLLEIKIKNT